MSAYAECHRQLRVTPECIEGRKSVRERERARRLLRRARRNLRNDEHSEGVKDSAHQCWHTSAFDACWVRDSREPTE